MIRDGAVSCIVNMRSNDAWAGYRNDYAWQFYMLSLVTNKLNSRGNNYILGNVHWNAGSLHIYERQFYLIDNYIETGETSITKEEYDTKHNLA